MLYIDRYVDRLKTTCYSVSASVHVDNGSWWQRYKKMFDEVSDILEIGQVNTVVTEDFISTMEEKY